MTNNDYKSKLSKQLNFEIEECNLQFYTTKYPQWISQPFNIKPIIDKTIDESNKYEYIKTKENMRVITIWSDIDEDSVLGYLDNIDAKLFFKKKIYLSYKGLCNLLYQLYADTNQITCMKDLESKISDNFDGWISVYFFENTKHEFEELIRFSISQMIEDDKDKGCINVSFYFYQTIEFASIYLFKNSLDFLEIQNIEKFMSSQMKKSRIMLATFRNWINKCVPLNEKGNYLLFSSVILYTFGLRGMNDLDLYIKCTSNPNDNELINKYFLNNNTKFCFIDATIKNTKLWYVYANDWEKNWLNLVGVNTFEEIVDNPKYHYYFLGLKIMTLDVDIHRRIKRDRPKAMADLILIKENQLIEFEMPSIPDKMYKYFKLDDKDKNKNGEFNKYMALPEAKYIPEYNEIEYVHYVDKELFQKSIDKWLKK